MNLPKASVAFALLLTAGFAGCVSGDDDPQPQQTEPIPSLAPPAQYDEETGAIQGTITDTELIPVAGAQVGIKDKEDSTTSAQDGSFSFSLVPPGEYVLLASALGYTQSATRVQVEAGRVTEGVEIRLERIPIIVPYSIVEEFKGYITCSIGTAGVISEECGQGLQHPLPPPVPNPIGRNERNNIDWKLNVTTLQDLETLHFELDWLPASAAASKLGFHVAHGFTCIPACGEDIAYCSVGTNFGPPAQHCTIKVDALGVQDPATDLPWDITARAWAAPVEATDVPNVVLEQAFTMYRTDFYGAPMPEGYTAVPPR